jgi:NAD(P)H-hydrate epimerase
MPVPVLTVASVREWELASWAAGRQEQNVMRRAGQAVARCAESLSVAKGHILIFAGRGHNGDDARFARESITGRFVRLVNVTDPIKQLAEVEHHLRGKPDLVIDGLFGVGLNRPLAPEWVTLIRAINQAERRVLAVDLPSGLDAESGQPLPEAVRADRTLTLGAPKQGLLEPSAWPWVGKLEVAEEIGLIASPKATDLEWLLPADFANFPKARPVAGHKGTFGHLGIVAGSLGYHGAAVLAARGAERAQPGLVSLLVPENIYSPVAAQLQATMVRPFAVSPSFPDSCSGFLMGPGLAGTDLSPTLKDFADKLWRTSPLPVVMDASAFSFLPTGETPAGALRVLTPHPGEAGRLLAQTTAWVQNNRPQALREISRRFGGCWVILKGFQTLIGRVTGVIGVNSTGNPHLGQGGSGDLLAGFTAGLLAQPALQADPEKTLRYAVWQHGKSADALEEGRGHWTIEELASFLGT